MGTVADMRRAFEQAAATIDLLVREIIDNSSPVLITLLQENLKRGLDGNDSPITPEYQSEAYARMKERRGSEAPLGTPDLRLSGGFYDRMAITWLTPDSFSIISEDVKWRKLMRMYGLDVMKLSEPAIQYFKVNYAHPDFIRKISLLTGAEFS